MRAWAVLLLSLAGLWLSGCAAPPTVAQADSLFADARFAPPSEPVRVADIFALSPEMNRYAASLPPNPKALVDALYTRGELKIEYDATMTRNAAQAFEARSGNCLSLVIMTAAFAKQLELSVYYQSVFTDETWARSGDIQFSIDHVNLSMSRRLAELDRTARFQQVLTVDFLPRPESGQQRARVLSEATVVAMFLNNRAAESLARGRVDDAYWWAREAVVQDPSLARAYNTLGVVYRRHGDLALAERVLRHALASEPDNPQVVSNLAQVLSERGNSSEARELRVHLARIEAEPPFASFDRGQEALRRGDIAAAHELFARQVKRAPYYHEFHYWLAVTAARLGEAAEARKHLALAMDTSTTRDDYDLYAGKLMRLQVSLAQ